MREGWSHKMRAGLVWSCVLAAVSVPVIAASFSPLLAWRDPIYIGAGFAGIIALALLLFQPLLALRALPGLSAQQSRLIHRGIGAGLVISVVAHVIGLWLTSPPDVWDALLFVSPTPFSAWGVIAMWAVFVSALIAAFRKRLRIRLRMWLRLHRALAVVIVLGSVVHAVQIQGTMEVFTKISLSGLIIVATAIVMLRVFRT